MQMRFWTIIQCRYIGRIRSRLLMRSNQKPKTEPKPNVHDMKQTSDKNQSDYRNDETKRKELGSILKHEDDVRNLM